MTKLAAALDKLDRLFGGKARSGPPKKVRPAPDDYTVESPAERALRLAREAQQRRWQLYLAKRAHRMQRLTDSHAGAARYVKALHTLAERNAVTVYTRRDIDVDLAELATRCKLDTIPEVYDRYLLVEYTQAWITTLPGGQRLGVDDEDPLPLDGRPTDTIDDLIAAVKVH